MTLESLPRYDPAETYRWNYDHAPRKMPRVDVPEVPGEWRFCGLPVDSPLGIPAGPLLNGRWCLYYAALGFDVVTYKTVRSRPRACYPLPNLLPVDVARMTGDEEVVETTREDSRSWAVSFGMPSMSPDIWRKDVERTRSKLPAGKVLCVSVVGTADKHPNVDQLADDYARCAGWAVEAGATVVEANFSCPNVTTCDGQLYQVPEDAGLVAARLKEAAGRVPLVIKIGHIHDAAAADKLLRSLAPHVNALAMTNSIASRVVSGSSMMFDRQPRGICGAGIRDASIAQVALFRRLIDQQTFPLEIIGVGGVGSASDVQLYLDAGASAVHVATAAMRDPLVGIAMRQKLRSNITEM